jgi:hypothetical protein
MDKLKVALKKAFFPSPQKDCSNLLHVGTTLASDNTATQRVLPRSPANYLGTQQRLGCTTIMSHS